MEIFRDTVQKNATRQLYMSGHSYIIATYSVTMSGREEKLLWYLYRQEIGSMFRQ
jgi:hypothetical protein